MRSILFTALAGVFAVASAQAGGIEIGQEGLTNAWYDPSMSGQGFEFVLSPATADVDGALFGAWYTFGPTPGAEDTQRWYSLQASFEDGATSAAFTIYANTGGNFVSPPATHAVAVGTGTLTFSDCTTAELDYAFDGGASGSLPLRSLLSNIECSESPNAIAAVAPSDYGFSGTWYDPTLGGQGFVINVNPADAQVFAGWYTYAANRAGANIQGQRWFSAQGPYTVGATSMDLALYATTGGTFASGTDPVTTTPVGTARLRFRGCDDATFDYHFTSGEVGVRNGTIVLKRLGATPASCRFGS
jgi:hypothetical protein